MATEKDVSIGMAKKRCIGLVQTMGIIDNKSEDGEKDEEIKNLGTTKSEEGLKHEEITNPRHGQYGLGNLVWYGD